MAADATGPVTAILTETVYAEIHGDRLKYKAESVSARAALLEILAQVRVELETCRWDVRRHEAVERHVLSEIGKLKDG